MQMWPVDCTKETIGGHKNFEQGCSQLSKIKTFLCYQTSLQVIEDKLNVIFCSSVEDVGAGTDLTQSNDQLITF
jgi:hypothetical protein